VGVDGSPLSAAALAYAYEAAAYRRVPLVAVHTWWDQPIDAVVAAGVEWTAVQAEEQRLLAQRLAGWCQKYPDVLVRRVVARARPAHALLAEAPAAQLVVVGARGRGGFAGIVLGSTSRQVLHHARCPVVVARPEPGRPR
jgi:nucleotide-binding universal stress UspA family protein